MLIDFSKLLLLTVAELLRRAWSGLERNLPLTARVLSLPAAFAEANCARRMERMVKRIAAMGAKIAMVQAQLRRGMNIATIEDDLRFRTMLMAVKNDMRALQCEAAAWQCDRNARVSSTRLRTALGEVASISEKTYAMADALLWELAELDRQREESGGAGA
jgi:hypothetical protein